MLVTVQSYVNNSLSTIEVIWTNEIYKMFRNTNFGAVIFVYWVIKAGCKTEITHSKFGYEVKGEIEVVWILRTPHVFAKQQLINWFKRDIIVFLTRITLSVAKSNTYSNPQLVVKLWKRKNNPKRKDDRVNVTTVLPQIDTLRKTMEDVFLDHLLLSEFQFQLSKCTH